MNYTNNSTEPYKNKYLNLGEHDYSTSFRR